MKPEQKKIIYKHARGLAAPMTLQTLVANSVEKNPEVVSRLEPVGIDESDVRFINFVKRHEGAIFGVLHRVSKGSAQQVINMEGATKSWDVSNVKAATTDKPHAEFVDGTVYFGVWNNHVLIHQTASCRTAQLEDHLNWLLSRPGVGESHSPNAPHPISLDDPTPISIRDKSDVPVRNIRIDSAIETDQNPAAPSAQSASTTFRPFGVTWDALKTIMESMGGFLSDDIRLDQAMAPDDLRVRLELSCTRKHAESGPGRLMGILGRALRHTDGKFYSMELVDGTIIRGTDIKIERAFRIKCVNKIPVLEETFAAMMTFFTDLVRDKTITEEEPFANVQ